MPHRSMRVRAVGAALALTLLAGCASPAPNAPSPSSDATQTPADATAAPTASPTSAPSGPLAIPLEFPCDAMDAAATEAIIGGPIAESNEWEPGDQPFGEGLPPSSVYGCQYSLAEEGPSPTFGILIPGEELSADDWTAKTADLDECRDLAAPAGIIGDAVMARVCPASAEGRSLVILTGLFGGTGVRCNVIVADDQVDSALEETVIEECSRILLELGS